MRDVRVKLWKAAFFVAFTGVSYVLLAPPETVAAIPGVPSFALADKVYHVLAFAALAVLGRKAYPEKPSWGIFAALVLYGIAIEIAQPNFGRNREWLDAVADAVGASAALLWLRPPARRVA